MQIYLVQAKLAKPIHVERSVGHCRGRHRSEGLIEFRFGLIGVIDVRPRHRGSNDERTERDHRGGEDDKPTGHCKAQHWLGTASIMQLSMQAGDPEAGFVRRKRRLLQHAILVARRPLRSRAGGRLSPLATGRRATSGASAFMCGSQTSRYRRSWPINSDKQRPKPTIRWGNETHQRVIQCVL